MQQPEHHSGFTLLEVMISIAIIGCILLLTWPIDRSFSQKNQADVIAEDIKSALLYARNRATINDISLTLAPFNEQPDWSEGMVLFANKDKILHQWTWHSNQVHVEWHGFRSRTFLTFSKDLHHASANGRFDIVTDSNYKIQIIVNRLGHWR